MFSGRACALKLLERNGPLRTNFISSKQKHCPRDVRGAHTLVASIDGEENFNFINWDQLGFGLVPTDYMYEMKCSKEGSFSQGYLTHYGNIELSPSAGILNYGQGLFEGLKAYRGNDNHILIFRPEQNALRMQMGAERMCMPAPTTEQFVDAIKQTVLANKRWVPPPGKGSLYVRPLLMGTGPILGLAPAPEYTFLAFASPVGNYHKGHLNVIVRDNVHRAFIGGTGGVKAITNYGPTTKILLEAKGKGYTDVLFLDAATGKYVEEVCSSNVFIVKGNLLSTPPINGTILPGITRRSLIEIAPDYGFQAEERDIPLEDVIDADEVFCTGTATVINPVASVTYKGKRVEYKTGAGTVAQKLYAALTGIQAGAIEDKMGWTVQIE